MNPYQGHLIIFEDAGFQGDHQHIFGTLSYIGDRLNDKTSSFVVLSGVWRFYIDAGPENLTGNKDGYGPGLYPWVEANDVGVTNDVVSAVELVAEEPNPVD
jgi:hypothetical protein